MFKKIVFSLLMIASFSLQAMEAGEGQRVVQKESIGPSGESAEHLELIIENRTKHDFKLTNMYTNKTFNLPKKTRIKDKQPTWKGQRIDYGFNEVMGKLLTISFYQYKDICENELFQEIKLNLFAKQKFLFDKDLQIKTKLTQNPKFRFELILQGDDPESIIKESVLGITTLRVE